MGKVADEATLLRQLLAARLPSADAITSRLDTISATLEEIRDALKDEFGTSVGRNTYFAQLWGQLLLDRIGDTIGYRTLSDLLVQIRDGIGTIDDGLPGQSLRQITYSAANAVNPVAMGIGGQKLRVHRARGLSFSSAVVESVVFNNEHSAQYTEAPNWDAVAWSVGTRYVLYGNNKPLGVQLSTAYPDNGQYRVELRAYNSTDFAERPELGAVDFMTDGGNGAGNVLLQQFVPSTPSIVWAWKITRYVIGDFGPEIAASGTAYPSLYIAYDVFGEP